MMRFEYDPQLVEQATFLAARQDAERECALHEALDGLYRINDAELRQRLFREAYAGLFRGFGLDQIIPSYVRNFRLISGSLQRCIVREAERMRAQSVDLYREKPHGESGPGERVVIMALCPDALLAPRRLGPWLYRQLQHVEDMLDDRFAYEPSLPEAPAPQQNVWRERYAILWDIDVEGRLLRSGRVPGDSAQRLWSAFCKAFSCAASSAARRTFDRLAGGGATHPQILAWATEPSRLFEGEGEHVEDEDGVCAVE